MSKERELLRRISSHSGSVIPSHFIYEIIELLVQPEPFTPDWVNYRQGVEDATREPLSDDVISEQAVWAANSKHPFKEGVRWAEQQHGIGVDDE